MLNHQIKKLKNIQFSIPSKNWLSTLLFLPLAIFFRFINGTWLVLDKDFTAYTQSVWVFGFVFFLWLGWKWFFDDRFLSTGVEVFLGFFFLVMCISTIFSENISLSIEKLIGITAYLFAIYILIDLKRNQYLWQGIINALLITAGISSLIILFQALFWLNIYQITPGQIITDPGYILDVIPRLPDFINLHPSVTAGYLVLILPLGAYQFTQTKKLLWKILLALGLILNMVVFILTKSRGGFLGLFIMLFTLVLLYRKSLVDFLFKSKFRTTLTALLGSMLLVGSIILLVKMRGFSLIEGGMLSRYQAWLTAFNILLEHPWLGSGLGTFGMKYLQYHNPAIAPNTQIHAHNEILQISAQLGILGLITLLMIFWQVLRQLRKEPGGLPASSRVALSALGGLFGVLIPDAIFTSSMIVLLFIFYLVWILPPQNNHPSFPKPWGLGLLSLAAVFLACGGGWIIWKIQPYNLALGAAEQDNWQEASTALLSALERDPGNPYYQHTLGYTHGQAACQSGERYGEALGYYQQSLKTYSGWGIDHANTAVLYAASGDYQSAANQMEMAIQYRPQNSFFSCLLGDYFLQLDKLEGALSSYGACIAENPEYLDSPYWQEEDSRKKIIPSVVVQAENYLIAGDDGQQLKHLAQLYLSTGKLEKANQLIREYLLENPSNLEGNLVYLGVLESSGDRQTAGEILENLLVSYPRVPTLWTYRGKLALEAGQEQVAVYSLNLSYRLHPPPYTAWLLGNYYQSQGELDPALSIYQKALNDTNPVSKFSRHVAARWPFQGIYVDCMPEMRTYSEYFDPALEAAQSLEDQNCSQAACIYQQLLTKNPTIEEAQIRLGQLPCSVDIDLGQCFFNEPD